MSVRVLTVRQPWAWAIVHAGKDVENRSRSLGPYRGPVLIHAGLTPVDDDDAIWDNERYMHALAVGTSKVRHRMDVRGAIIGVVDLVDVHRAGPFPGECYRNDPRASTDRCSPWADDGAHHLMLENPRALAQPVPWRGGLGLRKAPALEVVGDWLCGVVNSCTCHNPTSGPHEPGCGLEPLARLVAPNALPVVIEHG